MTDDRIPAHQGRPLPRPGEEVVDQGLGFDLGTLLGRRRVLAALGIGAVTAGLAACGAPGSTTSAGEIPEETAGPFPGDGSHGANVLTESGVVRRDIRSGFGAGTGTAQGVLMTLDLTIIDAARAPFAGAAVYVWHCDREGRYSLYSPGVENENYLRGVQVADAAGTVTFASIVPACYPGRWPHVHFEVYPSAAGITDAANAIATSQVALPRDVCEAVYATPGYEQSVAALSGVTLESDTVFGDDGGALQLATVTGDVTSGYRVALTAVVDTATGPGGGGVAAGPPGGN